MTKLLTTAATLSLLSISLARADSTNKETIMKTNQPIEVQGIVLEAGEHVFKLVEPNSDLTIVSIYNADQTRLEGVLMGMPAYRTNIDDKLFAVSQRNGNEPAVLRAWYFPNDNDGVEFHTAVKASQVAGKSKHNQQSAGSSENATR